jgi:hypothetical protein
MSALARSFTAIAVAIAALVVAAPAQAAWTALGGAGKGYSVARNLQAPATPTATVSNRQVTVNWTAPGGGVPPSGYVVKRYDSSNQSQAIGPGCSGTIAATSCVESAVPPGDWKYSVTAVRGNNWSGAESAKSSTVTVLAPALTLSPTTVTSFPRVLTGQITSFIPGQTVTYRLDNPTTGPLLSGSITPSTVPASGTASASVTIPAGTANGSHTVYAIGNTGDQASIPITVNAPKVTASVIAKSTGGRAGKIRQGGTYYVYANVSGSGGPPAGLATLTADVSAITTGQTAVPLSFGTFTVQGQSYNYRSAVLTANATLSEGSKPYTLKLTDSGGTVTNSSYSVTVDNTKPTAADVQATNTSGGIAGRAELGDTLTLTYSEQIEENSILAGWAGTATNVVVRLNNVGGGDTVRIYNAANTALLQLGTVNLARTDYTTSNRTFGATGTPSTMVTSGSDVVVVLGTPSGAVTTAGAASNMIWTPSATATDAAGNTAATTAQTESGALDLNF